MVAPRPRPQYLMSSHLLADVGVALAKPRDKLLVMRVLKHSEHVMINEHLPIFDG